MILMGSDMKIKEFSHNILENPFPLWLCAKGHVVGFLEAEKDLSFINTVFTTLFILSLPKKKQRKHGGGWHGRMGQQEDNNTMFADS